MTIRSNLLLIVVDETKSLVFGKLFENLKKILYNIYRKKEIDGYSNLKLKDNCTENTRVVGSSPTSVKRVAQQVEQEKLLFRLEGKNLKMEEITNEQKM